MTNPPDSARLPNRFDHRAAQQRIYPFWEERGYFHSDPDPNRKPYCIVIPPPNVTGALHLGHALNNTLQDICIRMKRMQGYNALWMPGSDHAGIATQAVVEKRLREEEGKTRHDLGREKLVERIWQWKDQYEARILTQLKQMGCSCDWRRTRFTLDKVCARAVRRTFFDLFRKKLIYRGKRLVNWDTFLQTAVSDDEVFHETVQGHFWHFRYPVIDPRPGEPEYVTIATTRPETMLGDTAVAVHPDPAAALDRLEAELAEKLRRAPAREREALEAQRENVRLRRRRILPQLEQLRDMARQGRRVLLPLLQRPIPLVADPWAKPELGSGCVKITPAHDPNDYEVAQRCGLPMINILRPDGVLNANAGPYRNLTVEQARERVVADLQRQGLIAEVEDREIDLAHSDRSKTPIEPYLADQWFIRMEQLAQSAMDAVLRGDVKILPPRYAKGYLDWLAEKRDWPVSRQLWWGHQIPIWSKSVPDQPSLDRLTAQLDRDPALRAGRIAYQIERLEEDQRSGAADDDADELPFALGHVCIEQEEAELESRFERQGFRREEGVLDTWFSSALWPHSTLGWPDRTPELDYYYPTSVLITSRDIITLWVARMVLAGLNNMGEPPFREVFIHPKILDGYGETMSKTKGNGVDPLDVIEKFGADALRFGLTYLATQTQDVRMPVQFECPHCGALIDQTRQNRDQPRVTCGKCGQAFSTQWADKPEDKALPRGPVVSERFEQARNFCNKLWNAARFVLMHLRDYSPGETLEETLTIEDRWILSRLATVASSVTDCLESYHFAEAARTLYDFAWDEFCSFYVEIAKERLRSPQSRPAAQRLLAHTLDQLLRLLHPIIPFLTEEVWRLLNQAAPVRGLPAPAAAPESVMLASWPRPDPRRRDPAIEEQFAQFQAALTGLREIRNRQGIPPRREIEFSVRCSEEEARPLQPMTPYFQSLARAKAVAWGPRAAVPSPHEKFTVQGIEFYVDLKGLIDVHAAIDRERRELEKLRKQIENKQRKLANPNYVQRAPAEIVQRDRDSLLRLQQEADSVQRTLAQHQELLS